MHASLRRGHCRASLHSVAVARTIGRAASAVDGETFVAGELRKKAGVDTVAYECATPLGRGLVVGPGGVARGQTIARVPIENTLVVSDDAVSGLSIFGDQHIRRHQELHGNLPDPIVDFLIGPIRWDVRLCAWLLHLAQGIISQKLRCDNDPAAQTEGVDGSSLWQLYTYALPAEETMNVLLNYEPTEQMSLQLAAFIEESERQRDTAQDYHFSHFFGESATLGCLALSPDLRSTLWALSMVRSRTFGLEVDGEGITIMAPYLDLANHAVNFNASFRLSDDKTHLELYAFEALKAGDEVLITYGEDKSNFELMRDYGFAVLRNPADEAFLLEDLAALAAAPGFSTTPDTAAALRLLRASAEAEQDAEVSPYRLSMLRKAKGLGPKESVADTEFLSCFMMYQALGGEGSAPRCPFKVKTGGNPRAQAALRSLVPFTRGSCDDDGENTSKPSGLFASLWTVPEHSNGRPAPTFTKARLDKQRQAVTSLMSLISQLVQSSKTSLAEDEHTLGTLDAPPRIKQAIRARIEYKKVVQSCVDLLETYLHWLSDPNLVK